MNRLELVQRICADTGLKQSKVVEVMDSMRFHIVDALRMRDSVAFGGLGFFGLGKVPARVIKNVRTGVPQLVRAHLKIVFKPAAALKQLVE